jgi:hypothetical protein
VTTPTASAAGFSGSIGRRQTGQPGPENVLRRVHVGVRRVTACQATEQRLANAVPCRDVPAPRAGLRGMAGIDLNHYSSGTFSLGAQRAEKHPPPRVEDRAVQAAFSSHVRSGCSNGAAGRTSHIPDPQCLMCDQVVVPHECECGLMREVQSLAADLAMDGRDALARLLPAYGARLTSRHGSLRVREPGGQHGEVMRVRNVRTVARGHEVRDPHVDADDCARGRTRLCWYAIAGKDHKPAPAFPLDRDCLDSSAHFSMLAHFDLSNPLQPHSYLTAARSAIPLTTVPVFWPLDCVEPAATLKPRIPWLLPSLDAAEERSEGFIQAAQRGLLGGERPAALPIRVVTADVFKVSGLVAIPHRDGRFLPSDATVLQSGVVQLPVILQTSGKSGSLYSRRSQKKLTSSSHTHQISIGRARSGYSGIGPFHTHSYQQVPSFLSKAFRREEARTSRHLKTAVTSARI